jgi:hypothetical protein
MGKRPEEFGDWVLSHNLDIKVAFMVPKIGSHAILAFTGEGGMQFYGFGAPESQVIGVHLQSMDGSEMMDTSGGNAPFDFSKRLTEQRTCQTKQKGCIFNDIAAGKYVMRFYPMNLTNYKDMTRLKHKEIGCASILTPLMVSVASEEVA